MRVNVRRLALACALVAGVAACGSKPAATAIGNADTGRVLVRQYGCGGCHRIPGVATADGVFGPPLVRIGRRVYLAGLVANTPENMVRWIRAPQAIDPRTAMPDLGVGEAQARDMTAYLMQLK
jgi:cytochrome c1